MKGSLILIFILIACFCVCCNNSDYVKYEKIESKERLKKIIYKNNQKFSEQIITLDSIPNGEFREFDSRGLKCIGKYVNGQQDSTWIYYYSGTDVSLREENWFEGKKFGEQKEFYSNGYLKQYVFNNISGRKIFLCDFDLNRRITNVVGFPMYLAYNKTLLNKGEVFEFMCFFSKGLPSHSLYIELIEQNILQRKVVENRVITDSSMFIDLPFARKYTFEKKYSSVGTFEVNLKYILMDSIKQLVKSDSMKISLSVK